MRGVGKPKIEELTRKISALSKGQLAWLERVIKVYESPFQYKLYNKDFLNETSLQDFGDAMRIHHCFSAEPFTKDKFEFVLEHVLKTNGHQAKLAPKGNRGHDIVIDGVRVSLKTQADKNIKPDKIWISKFMELGKGQWGDDPKDLDGLRAMFLSHLKGYQRILTLRALKKAPEWFYELVEIPKDILIAAAHGTLEMMSDSRQFPKPGYCHVKSPEGQTIYELYFDAGGERKLQVKNLLKNQCVVHATWKFFIQPE